MIGLGWVGGRALRGRPRRSGEGRAHAAGWLSTLSRRHGALGLALRESWTQKGLVGSAAVCAGGYDGLGAGCACWRSDRRKEGGVLASRLGGCRRTIHVRLRSHAMGRRRDWSRARPRVQVDEGIAARLLLRSGWGSRHRAAAGPLEDNLLLAPSGPVLFHLGLVRVRLCGALLG